MSLSTARPRRPPLIRFAWLTAGGGTPLLGLALIAALLPLRANWGADLVLVCLAFTVPGVIALRAARVDSARVLAFPVYIPAASLLVMFTAGLACDLIGPPLGLTRPLHGVATALATLGLAIVLWVAGVRAPAGARLPWRRALDRPSDLVPVLLLPISALGALLLSNAHGDALARASLLLDVAVLFTGLLLAERLGRRRAVILLFCCALAVEWAWSLRGQGIIGFDISTELFVAQHTNAVGVWHTVHHNDAYGAMLSVTVLPSVLKALCGLSPLIAFKVLFPAFSALLPVAIFLLGDRFLTRRFAFGAACLLLTQDYFFQQLPELARQEVGLVFFAALVAAILDTGMRRRTQVALTVAMSLGLVVSHYSSTYLAIPLVLVAFVARAGIARWRRLSLISPALLCATVALIGGAGLWYGEVTHSASNLTAFASTLRDKGLDVLPSSGGALNTFFNSTNVHTVSPAQLERMAVRAYRRQAFYVNPLAAARQPRYALRSAAAPAPAKRIPALSTLVDTDFLSLYNELLLVALGVGTILMLVRRRWPPFTAELAALGFGGFAFLLFIRVSATASAQYNESRALAQSLIILALPAAWLFERLVSRLRGWRGRGAWIVLSSAIALLFAQQTGAFSVIFGGGTSLNVAASGEDFERYYQTPAELSGARWAEVAAAHTILYADRYGQLRIFATNGRPVLTSVMPRTLDRYAWVYGTRTNVRLHHARAQVDGALGTYRWPSAFLDRYFDVVYNDGDSAVYHG